MGWTILGAGVLLFAVMICAWITQRLTRNVGWVDVYWTFGTGAAGAGLALARFDGAAPDARQILVAVLALIWALRLGLYVALRVAHSPEDRRYVEIREEWGAAFQGRLFGFLMIQAAVGLLLAVAIMLAARNPAPGLGPTDLIGAGILAAAILGEGVADEQMRRFKADRSNHGLICDQGLWAWSRHPNYFFEWFGWLAYPVIAWPVGGVYLWGLAAWVAPVLMYLVLARGTGVPPLEAHMLKSRGQAFADYQARVSRFFPAPPRARPS
jgi:steroid 5-alpha reductase family enzyme